MGQLNISRFRGLGGVGFQSMMAISPTLSHHHTSIFRCISLFVLMMLSVLFCEIGIAASGQNGVHDITASLDSARAKSVERLDVIKQRISVLDKVEAPESLQKTELTVLTQAADFLQKNIASIDRTLGYFQLIQGAPLRLKSIEKELAEPLPGGEIKIDEKLPLPALEAQLENSRAILENERRARADVEAETTQRNERQQKITEELAATRKRLDELKIAMAMTVDAGADKSNENRKTALLAEKTYLEQQLQELEQENRSYDNRRELLRARRQLAERRVLVAEREFNALEQVVNRLRTEVAAQAIQVADAASLAAASAHPLVRTIADENQKFAAELANISVSSTLLSQEKQQLDEVFNNTRRDFEGIKEKIAQIGLTDGIGLKLRSDRSQMPDAERYTVRMKTHHDEINRVQLRRIELEDRLLELVDLKRESERRVSTYQEEMSESDQTALVAAVQSALGKQKESYLNELIKAYDTYFEKNLYPILEGERDLITLIEDYREFIDTRILWIQSARHLEFNDFLRLGSATKWLLSPFAWGQIFAGLARDLRDNPLAVIVPLFFIGIMMAMRRRLKDRLSVLGRYVTKLSKAKFSDTLWAGGVTVLMTIPWPLLIYLIAWRVGQLSTDTIFATALSSGLYAMGHLLLIGQLLRRLCRKEGLGEAHFRWRSENLKLIRKQLNWFLPLALPLVFIIAATLNQPTQTHHDSMGRFAFFILMGCSMLVAYRLMHPASGLLKHQIERNPEGWLNRLTGIWFAILLLIPFGLTLAAAMGYMYTAVQLSLYLMNTLGLLFAITVAREFLIRWLNIAQRKLALEQWRKKSLAQAESAPTTNEKPSTGESTELTPTAESEAAIDVAAISTQTMKLLNSAFWFAIAVGMFFIWAEILPALNILDQVVLWTSDTASSGSGSDLVTQVPTTLTDLLLAIIILLMTFFVSGNIPGLLEIAILQRLPFTPSGRYAITSIVRYILVIVGLAMTFSAMGIGWSKVQWLAAAITLGLGFGLQEIFANFVSGLIILFERPVRVGDAVTIGNISGKISRIQMRATMITDWDRKELIIPNKEFVTGQVINWSLTDTILRVMIPVGIAYGSDTRLAYDTLLAVAADHPNVLKDPESTARFVLFGESSLDFELRVYIPHPDVLLETRHDILMEIDRRFREAKIEIAFPQRDIHIRNMPDSATLLANAVKKDDLL